MSNDLFRYTSASELTGLSNQSFSFSDDIVLQPFDVDDLLATDIGFDTIASLRIDPILDLDPGSGGNSTLALNIDTSLDPAGFDTLAAADFNLNAGASSLTDTNLDLGAATVALPELSLTPTLDSLFSEAVTVDELIAEVAAAPTEAFSFASTPLTLDAPGTNLASTEGAFASGSVGLDSTARFNLVEGLRFDSVPSSALLTGLDLASPEPATTFDLSELFPDASASTNDDRPRGEPLVARLMSTTGEVQPRMAVTTDGDLLAQNLADPIDRVTGRVMLDQAIPQRDLNARPLRQEERAVFTGVSPPSWPELTYSTFPESFDAGVDLARQTTVQIRVDPDRPNKLNGSGTIIGRDPYTSFERNGYEQYLIVGAGHVVHSERYVPVYDRDDDITIVLPGGQTVYPQDVAVIANGSRDVVNVAPSFLQEGSNQTDLSLLVARVYDPRGADYRQARMASDYNSPQDYYDEKNRSAITGGFTDHGDGYARLGLSIASTLGPVNDDWGSNFGLDYQLTPDRFVAGHNAQTRGGQESGNSGGPVLIVDPINRNGWVYEGTYGAEAYDGSGLYVRNYSLRYLIEKQAPGYLDWLPR